MTEFASFFSAYGVFILGAIAIAELFLLAWVMLLHRKWKTIFGSNSGDLERAFRELQGTQDAMHKEEQALLDRVSVLERAMPQAIRHIGLVRYNPFSDAGGDQSFAVALLDDRQNGMVISSLYGREMNRVYAKPIENGASKYQLSEEEKEAIRQAMQRPAR